MAVQMRPTAYTARTPPDDPAQLSLHVATEFRAVAISTTTLSLMTPQPATQVPRVLADGMIRLARAPWRPVSGQTTDRWCFYDAPTNTWLYLV